MMQIRNNEIGARIMALRTDMGLTRERMAEKVGITSKFLYEIEVRGTGFSVYTLLGIAQTLGVSTDYILTGKENGNYDDEMLETMRMFSSQIWKKIKKMLLIINDIAK
ncbi:MAG: helix-turn-helix domain-containing protein [Eubacterium sp.]